QILPAAFEYRKFLAESAAALKTVDVVCEPEVEILQQLAPLVATLQKEYRVLVDVTAQIVADGETGEANAHAQAAYDQLVPVIARVRDAADALEATVADKFWPLPKYTELLLTI
ncbi:hypothetical protein H4R20_006598, partial [Coemansia guatemalensis]